MLLQPIVPCSQGNRGVEVDHRSVLTQCFCALPELHYGDASVNPQGPTTGPVVTSLDLKDAYFHIGIHPADRRYLRFCHNGTAWQFTVLPFGLSTSPRVFTKILKPVLAYAHLHRVKLHMYIDDWLLNPGTHQEALEQSSWLKSLCQKLGLVLNLEKSDLIPSQVATYLGIELDTSVGLARPSHKRLTNWLSVAEGFTAQQSPPAVQWLKVLGHRSSLSRETSALWSNSHSPHSMAIETPVESVEGGILKTDPTRPSVPPGHPMVDQQGQFTKGSPNRDHRCGVLPVHRQQYSGLGCPLAGSNCIWHLVPGPVPTTHQCPGASSQMTWPKSFQPKSGECEGCSHVRQHVSGCLPEKSGGHQIARNERKEGNDTSSPLPSRSSVPEGSNPQDRVEPKPDRSRQDFSCLGQTIRGPVRPREEHEIGNIRLTHLGGDVLESGQSCPELGRPVRVRVPSDKPDKGLSEQGQNRKRRDRPDSASLAQPGVVSGPTRSLNRLSNNSPTSAETAQADLLTPPSSASVESQPSLYRGYQGIPQGERIF